MFALEVLVWTSLGLVLYGYLGFPLLTFLQGLCWPRPYRSSPITPTVSLIVCCHNEAAGIVAKLDNLLALDYPAESLQILVASDGSTDETEELVTRLGHSRVTLLRLPRRGKAVALNAAAAVATGDVLVFSDANSLYAADAVRQLVQPFADETVGGVAGNQVYRKSYSQGLAASGEQLYWDFDRWMKRLQSRSGNTISATGAIYAIRRRLFQSVPDGVTDDFVTSTRVIAQGFRLVFAADAVCYEPVAGAAKAEFGRKVRIITRGLRGVLAMRTLLNPLQYGVYSLQLWSHKVLRRLVVFPLLILAAVTPWLWSHGLSYQILTIGQAVFYGAAALGGLCTLTRRKPPKLLAVPVFFCLINAAVLVATWNIVRGRRITVWNPHRGPAEWTSTAVPTT